MKQRTEGWSAVAVVVLGYLMIIASLSGGVAQSALASPFSDWKTLNRPNDTVHIGRLCGPEFVPPGSPVCHPVAFSVPKKPKPGGWPVTLNFEGWNAKPDHCLKPTRRSPGDHLQIDICPGHFPQVSHYAQGNANPKGHGGHFLTDNNHHRVKAALTHAYAVWAKSVDWHSITITGRSYGATWAILEPIFLRKVAPEWQKNVTVVRALAPNTLFVRKGRFLSQVVLGEFWTDNTIPLAWKGLSPSQGDWRIPAKQGKLSHIYWSLVGSVNDGAVNYDLGFFNECQLHGVMCFGWWGNGNHSNVCPAGADNNCNDTFSGPDSEWRRDKLQPIFHNASSNISWFDQCGSYNLGLEWHSGKEVNTRMEASLPIRYRPRPAAGCLKAQPATSTTDLTLRNLKLTGPVYWQYGTQQGGGYIDNKSFTIEDLELSNTGYKRLTITPAEQPCLVYTRQPRGPDKTANWLRSSDDSGHPIRGTEADLVKDCGVPEVIHDCTGDNFTNCVAQEAAVSPDGNRIAYSVGTGPGPRWPIAGALWEFDMREARIWIHEVNSGRSYPVSSGNIDRQPQWLDNETLVYASTEAETYPPMAKQGQYYNRSPAFHIWQGTLDGRTLVDRWDMTPHAANAFAPLIATDGSVLYADWNGYLPREFVSPRNHWWVMKMDRWGKEANEAFLGAHGTPHLKGHEYLQGIVDPARRGAGIEMLSFLPIGEIYKGRIAGVTYYRGNHGGRNGVVLSAALDKPGEGVLRETGLPEAYYSSNAIGSGRFTPSTLFNHSPYGMAQDEALPRFDVRGRAMGKMGPVAPIPKIFRRKGKGFLATRVRGHCYDPISTQNNTRAAMGGEPTCEKSIAIAWVDRVTNPFNRSQLEPIACVSEDYNCWDPHFIVPYSELHGQDLPDYTPPVPETGELRIVDARAHQIFPIPNKLSKVDRISFGGNGVEDYSSRVAFICVDIVEQWMDLPAGAGWENRYRHKCVAPESDGSLRIRIPDKNYVIYATDAQGNVIAEDHRPLSGSKTCHGCHDGHSQNRALALGDPVERFRFTRAGRGL